MSEFKLGGWKPDQKDDRDFKIDLLLPKLNDQARQSTGVDLRRFCTTVENQGSLGSCVANAVVGALELLQVRAGGDRQELSRLFIYYNARLQHRDELTDAGTYIRTAMKTLSSLGTCDERSWPYDTSKVFVRPTWASYRVAYGNKINSFYRIEASGDERIELIKAALDSQHPVVYGSIVNEDFLKLNSENNTVDFLRKGAKSLGAHAMLIVGYRSDDNTLIVRNSWGTSWGDQGYFYLAEDTLTEMEASDFWVPTDLV